MTATFESLKVGDEIPKLVKGPVTRQHLAEWCAAENDYYPIHFDERIAKGMGLPGAPIQGTYRYALMGQMVARWIGPKGRLRRITCAYRGLNLEDETISCGGTVKGLEPDGEGGRVVLEVWVENAQGERSSTGEATVWLPRRR